jgi:acetoin utilization deacetylase AcuC-like enzyme
MNKNKVGLVFFPAYDWEISPTHPERVERLLYTQDQLFEEGIQDIDGLVMINPVLASEKDIHRVHFCVPDVSSVVSMSHRIAAGGTIVAGESVMNKEVDKAFALIRPPGHHAQRIVYGNRGFCVVNNEAIMIEHLRKKYGSLKVAIVDSDAHHGDGTENIYWNDKDTLVISMHQDGRTLYPGTGFLNECGGPSAYGYNINIPLPPDTAEEGFLYILEQVVMPILSDFKPDLIVNSAGQDNHYSDPITNMRFTAHGYAKLNEILDCDIAVLEGGYSIEDALPYINLGIILAMAGLDYSQVKEPDYDEKVQPQDPQITKYIQQLSQEILNLWNTKEIEQAKLIKNKESIEVNRRVYYDTDQIMEHQHHHYKVCSLCHGLEWVDSTSDQGYHILAISLPRDACIQCEKEGYAQYESTEDGFTDVYLQDKKNDEFLHKTLKK